MLTGKGEQSVAIVFQGAGRATALDFEEREEVENERVWGQGFVWRCGGGGSDSGTAGRGFPGGHRKRWQRVAEEQRGKRWERICVDRKGRVVICLNL